MISVSVFVLLYFSWFIRRRLLDELPMNKGAPILRPTGIQRLNLLSRGFEYEIDEINELLTFALSSAAAAPYRDREKVWGEFTIRPAEYSYI